MAKKRDVRARRTSAEPTGSSAETESFSISSEVDAAAKAAAERRRQRSRKPRLKRRLIIFGILALLVLVVWLNWDSLNPQSVWTWLSVTVTGGETGDGYPAQIEGSSVVSMAPVDRYLAVLTDNTLDVYNRTAGKALSFTHNFASPQLDTAGGRILIAELGGRRVCVTTVGGRTTEVQTAHNIVAASVAENGSFAVVTDSDKSHISEVVFYNNRGEEKLHWYSSEALLLGIALRKDARQMAAIGLCSENGAAQSRLMIFDTSSAKEPAKYTGEEVMLCAVEYLSGGQVAAIGDTETWIVRPGREQFETCPYSDMQLLGYAVSDNQVSVSVRPYGATRGGQVLTFDQNGKSVYQHSFEGMFRDLSSSPKGFLLLTDGTLTALSDRGDPKSADVPSDGLMVTRAFGSVTVVLELTVLSAFNVG